MLGRGAARKWDVIYVPWLSSDVNDLTSGFSIVCNLVLCNAEFILAWVGLGIANAGWRHYAGVVT